MRRMAGELPSGEEAGKAFAWLGKSQNIATRKASDWRWKC
jgi:transketolase